MANITAKSQALNSVLVLAGIKGNYSITAAHDALQAAALHAITDGNNRPFDDTRAAITKGLTKDGNFANNLQGVILSALIMAQKSSRAQFEQLHNNGLNSKNEVKFDKKLTIEDKAAAAEAAAAIGAMFEAAYIAGFEALKTSRAAASEKTATTKKAAIVAADTKAAAEAAIVAERAAEAAKNTFTISEFLRDVNLGKGEALALAEVIAAALATYKIQAAAPIAKKETTKERAARLASNKAQNEADRLAA